MDSNDNKLETSADLGCLSGILVLACGVGLLGWIYIAMVTLGYYGFPKDLLSAFVLFYPFVYLSLSIYNCYVKVSQTAFTIYALLLNFPLVTIAIYSIVTTGAFNLGIGIILIFNILWLFLYIERCFAKEHSGLNP